MVDTNKNNVLIIINYVNNYEKYCVYNYSSKKFVSANIYIPSLVFFFFFFFHLTRLTILLVGDFPISKTPGFNKISRACDLWWKA